MVPKVRHLALQHGNALLCLAAQRGQLVHVRIRAPLGERRRKSSAERISEPPQVVDLERRKRLRAARERKKQKAFDVIVVDGGQHAPNAALRHRLDQRSDRWLPDHVVRERDEVDDTPRIAAEKGLHDRPGGVAGPHVDPGSDR